MSIIESSEQSAPEIPAPKGPRSKPSGNDKIVIVVLIAVLAVILAFAAVAAGLLVGSTPQTDAGQVEFGVAVEEAPVGQQVANPIAYGYFGEVAIQAGASINLSVDGPRIESTSDVQVVTVPTGITADIIAGENKTVQLDLNIADDVPSGKYIITFDITGEPETVEWTFTVSPG